LIKRVDDPWRVFRTDQTMLEMVVREHLDGLTSENESPVRYGAFS